MKRINLWLAVFVGLLVVVAIALLPKGTPHSELKPRKAPPREARQSELPLARERMGFPLLPLLTSELVQHELALSDEQQLALGDLAAAYADELAHDARGVQQLHSRPAAQEAAILAVQDKQRRLLAEHGQSAVELLSIQQLMRLDQILFQLRSVEAYAMPEIAAALALTEQQKLEIGKIRHELETAAGKLAADRKAGTLSPQEFDRGVGRDLQHAAEQAMLALDARQCQQVEVWRGQPLPFTRQSLRLAIRGNRAGG